MSPQLSVCHEGAPADANALVVALQFTLEALVADIQALRCVLESAPNEAADGPFLGVADAALARMGAMCDVAAQVAGGLAYGGHLGQADFVNEWCAPKHLHGYVSAILEGGAA